MLEFLTNSPMPQLLLLLGGLLAIVVAVLGNKPKMALDNVARILGFLVGAVLIALAVALLVDKMGATSTWIIALLLGLGLFFKIFKKVPVALLLALIIGAIVGFLMYEAGVDNIVTLIIVVVIVLVVYILTRFIEVVADLIGRILGLRPVLFILGILGLIEAALIFAGSSLSNLL